MTNASDMAKLKERIDSEARACCRITNQDLVCRDCMYAFDDNIIFGNTSRCRFYDPKPNHVLTGDACEKYRHR